MGSAPPEEYLFVCPECGEPLDVDAAMRDTLLSRGCLLCGAAVTAAAFTRNPASGAR